LKDHSRGKARNTISLTTEETSPAWVNVIRLLMWLTAGVVAFIPFAFDTSPWNAVTLHDPGNQGNWWHLLAGVPFFLAYPAIWLRPRTPVSATLNAA
jgi:hypothetical protein